MKHNTKRTWSMITELKKDKNEVSWFSKGRRRHEAVI